MLTAAQRFLVLAMVIAHTHSIELTICGEKRRRFVSYDNNPLVHFLEHRIFLVLAKLLRHALEESLLALDKLLAKEQKRGDWPAICLALCLISFAVESMQVDAYMRREVYGSLDTFLDPYPIDCLSHVLQSHSRGFSPLQLDWTVGDNVALIEGDGNKQESLNKIQLLSQEYSK